jgi:hypothetical protein
MNRQDAKAAKKTLHNLLISMLIAGVLFQRILQKHDRIE